MKIVVPLAGAEFSAHFGQSTGFALFESEEGGLTRTDLVAPAHEHGAFAAFLSAQGADVVLAGGMGAGARQACAEVGVHVVVGVVPGEPESLASAYVTGDLVTAKNACGGHGCAH